MIARTDLKAPQGSSCRPPWFIGNRTGATTGRLLTQFAAGPRPDRLPAIFASALRG